MEGKCVPKGTPIADNRRYQSLKRLATSVKPLRGKAVLLRTKSVSIPVTTQSSSLEQRKNRKNNGKTEYIVP